MKLERHAGVIHLEEQRAIQEQRQSEQIAQRADAFKAVFSGPRSADVLEDLASFCFANRTTVASETNMAVLEGRRQVWLHIQQLLNR